MIVCDDPNFSLTNFNNSYIHTVPNLQVSKNPVKPTVLKCSSCSYTTNILSDYEKHTTTHKKVELEQSLFSVKQVPQSYKLSSDIQFTDSNVCLVQDTVQSDPKHYICELCLRSFSCHERLKHHMIGMHCESPDLPCGYCGEQFDKCRLLMGHVMFHHMFEGMYNCVGCDQMFKNEMDLYNHFEICLRIENEASTDMLPKIVSVFSLAESPEKFDVNIPEALKDHIDYVKESNDSENNIVPEETSNIEAIDVLKDIDSTKHQENRPQDSKTLVLILGSTIKPQVNPLLQPLQTRQLPVTRILPLTMAPKNNLSTSNAASSTTTSASVQSQVKEARKLNLFQCSKCDQILTSEISLGIHDNMHNKNVKFGNDLLFCDICKKLFSSRLILMSHIVNTHSSVLGSKPTVNNDLGSKPSVNKRSSDLGSRRRHPFKCKGCHAEFSKRRYIEKHVAKCTLRNGLDCSLNEMIQFEDSVLYRCPFCIDKCFSTGTLETLKKHVEIIHQQLCLRYQCRYCDFRTNTPEQQKQHELATHSVDNPPVFKCKYCEKCYTSNHSWWHHRNVHTTVSKLYQLKCDQCPGFFKDHETLFLHRVRKHSMTKDEVHLGQLFKFTAVRKSSLKVPDGSDQPEAKKAKFSGNEGGPVCKCKVCIQNFKILQQEHLQEPDAELLYKCTVCDYSTDSAENARDHEIEHLGVLLHACITCGLCFPTRPRLTKHRTQWHDNLDPDNILHRCNKCSKQFISEKELSAHEKVEHRQLLYQCKFCTKRSYTLLGMGPHIRLKHSNFKSQKINSLVNKLEYACKKCDQRFISTTNLSKHFQNNHRTILKFICQVCSKSFEEEVSVKKHIKRVHNNKLTPNDIKPIVHYKLQCEFCPNDNFSSETELTDHINVIHVFGNMFRCRLCRRVYKTKILLKKHLKIHRRESAEVLDSGSKNVNTNTP